MHPFFIKHTQAVAVPKLKRPFSPEKPITRLVKPRVMNARRNSRKVWANEKQLIRAHGRYSWLEYRSNGDTTQGDHKFEVRCSCCNAFYRHMSSHLLPLSHWSPANYRFTEGLSKHQVHKKHVKSWRWYQEGGVDVDKADSEKGMKAMEELVQEQRMKNNRAEIEQVLRSYFVAKNGLPTSHFHKLRGFNERVSTVLIGEKQAAEFMIELKKGGNPNEFHDAHEEVLREDLATKLELSPFVGWSMDVVTLLRGVGGKPDKRQVHTVLYLDTEQQRIRGFEFAYMSAILGPSTGANLYDDMKKIWKIYRLPFEKIMMISSDRASNYVGSLSGAKSLFLKENPHALMIKCANHILQSTVQAGLKKSPLLQKVDSVVAKICADFGRSGKMHARLAAVLADNDVQLEMKETLNAMIEADKAALDEQISLLENEILELKDELRLYA